MTKLTRYQQELCMNLCTLLPEDKDLLNDTIIEYVQLLGNTNRMHDLHEYTCKELENDLGVHCLQQLCTFYVSLLQTVTNACITLQTLL